MAYSVIRTDLRQSEAKYQHTRT